MKQGILIFLCYTALFACNSKPTLTENTTTSKPAVVGSSVDTLCYLKTEGPDSTKVRLILNGDKVTGNMDWLPSEKDGAIGTLAGKRSGDTIYVDYNFVIEGDNEIESKIFVLKGDKLVELSGELEDKNGKSVMVHPEKATPRDILSKVASNKLIFDYE